MDVPYLFSFFFFRIYSFCFFFFVTWEMESLIVEFDLLLTSDLLGEYVEIDLENPVVDFKIIGVEEKFLKPRGIIGDVVNDPEVRVRVQ